MLALDLTNAPRWHDLAPGVRVQLRPLTTALMVATRSDPAVEAVTEEASDEERAVAFAKALEKLSGGVDIAKLFPIPELSTHQFPECRKYVEMGLYHTMYYFSPSDYRRLAEVWTGAHPDGAPDLVVSEDPIPTLSDPPPAESEPQLAAPVPPPMDPGFLKEVAQRIFGPKVTT